MEFPRLAVEAFLYQSKLNKPPSFPVLFLMDEKKGYMIEILHRLCRNNINISIHISKMTKIGMSLLKPFIIFIIYSTLSSYHLINLSSYHDYDTS
jgi:hypothetical protein